MSQTKRQKEKTHSDRPSAAEQDARILAFHQHEWEQISVRDPYLRSLRLLIARYDLAKYLLDTYPPESVRTSPHTIPACLQALTETKKQRRFERWAMYAQVMDSLEDAIKMGGPAAFWHDLRSWEQQGMRARTLLTKGVMSFAEVFYLRLGADQSTAVTTPRPAFLEKVRQSFDIILNTYTPEHGELQAFLQAKFQQMLDNQTR